MVYSGPTAPSVSCHPNGDALLLKDYINQSSMTWTNYVKRYSTVRPPETAEIAG
jgi:hypothetical protein